MVDNGTTGVGDGGDAALAAREFRVSLEHRRDIDDLVAAAVTVRQRATVEAAEIVRNAEALARGIVADAQQEAARLTAEAKQALEDASARNDRADAVLGEQVSATIGRLESMASDVQMALDSALADVTESLAPVAGRRQPDHVASSSDKSPGTQARAAAEARLDRWRDRLRQAR